VLVDGDPLVGQRVDHRDFGRERRVEQVPVGESLAFGHDPDDLGIGGEVDGAGIRGGRLVPDGLRNNICRMVHDDLVVVRGRTSASLGPSVNERF
jgi:hypothetical protein